jgi:hypothetical protein
MTRRKTFEVSRPDFHASYPLGSFNQFDQAVRFARRISGTPQAREHQNHCLVISERTAEYSPAGRRIRLLRESLIGLAFQGRWHPRFRKAHTEHSQPDDWRQYVDGDPGRDRLKADDAKGKVWVGEGYRQAA